MHLVLQLFAALLVLAAFALAQAGILTTSSRAYLVPNVVGAALLALDAGRGGQWGFLLLEGAWALVAAAGLGRRRQ